MKTFVKKEIIGAIIFGLIIICYLISYEDIKHPFDSPSPSGSGKLFYLFLYYLDKYLGKFGVFGFFGFWFLYFLVKGIKWKKIRT